MKKITLLLIMFIIGLPMGMKADSSINLTPVPMKMTKGSGELVLPQSFTISTGNLAADLAAEGSKFAGLFSNVSGYDVTVVASGDALIRMQKYTGSEELGNEGYTLDITTDGITIAANSANGFYYAFQSVKKMLPANVMAEVKDENVTRYSLPVVSIVDAPRFEYRGFMLDVSRHYFTTDQIKRMIDVMSYYKMNRFHWHLTDDQGWRIEIKKYPKLTEVGAWRDSKVCAWGDVKPDGIRYGGYYTHKDIKEVVEYAKERFIEIVPEVDIPGHSQAAVASYPEFLACDPENKHEVWLWQGVSADVINVANPKAVQFAKDVIDELTELFPFGYIHLGGDECPTYKWEQNSDCQALLKEIGSKNYRDLQINF